MTTLLQLYLAANSEAKSEDVNSAVKYKFLHGINDTLHRNIFIFCINPFCDDVSLQALLKASRDAVVHLSASVSSSASTPAKSSLSAQPPVFTTASAASLTPQLDKVLALIQQLADKAKITNAKLDQQQQEINFPSKIPFNLPMGLISRRQVVTANINEISADIPALHQMPTLAGILPVAGIPSRG